MVLLLGDEATVDDDTGGLRGGRLEVEGDLTHPLSGEGEHGDGREVAADTEVDDRRGLGEGAKSEEARGGDAAARRDATSYVASAVGAEDDRCVAKPTRLGHQVFYRRRSDRRRGRGCGHCREVIKLHIWGGRSRQWLHTIVAVAPREVTTDDGYNASHRQQSCLAQRSWMAAMMPLAGGDHASQ
ncbi:hypothetical protein B296_00056422 [Ensete ventricosum]|uniref:Uncharacterized protein n=1 Tax=Ensete ventricosum TaxID=4639 RepID=A0A426WX34_ENSVE|nr:hypothetical protein B296_00056422 [Ensete ventricosum]